VWGAKVNVGGLASQGSMLTSIVVVWCTCSQIVNRHVPSKISLLDNLMFKRVVHTTVQVHIQKSC